VLQIIILTILFAYVIKYRTYWLYMLMTCAADNFAQTNLVCDFIVSYSHIDCMRCASKLIATYHIYFRRKAPKLRQIQTELNLKFETLK